MRPSPADVATFTALAIVGIGVASGFQDAVRIPLQVLHRGVAATFVLMAPLLIYVHVIRFYARGASDWIAWLHFVLLAALLHLAVRMARTWGARHQHDHFDGGEAELRALWKRYGVEWHATNPRVQAKLRAHAA